MDVKIVSENSSAAKLGKYITSDFSMSTILSSKSIESKDDVYRGKDFMKGFCESLRVHAMEVINFKKKKKKLLTKEQKKSHENEKIGYICKEKYEDKSGKYKKSCKARHRCKYPGENRGAAHRMLNLKYSVPKEIPFFTVDLTMIIILS